METTVEPSTTTSWTVLRRFKSRNKSERGRVMFVPRLSRYFNSLFLSLSRSLRSKRRKKKLQLWLAINIYIFLPFFIMYSIYRENRARRSFVWKKYWRCANRLFSPQHVCRAVARISSDCGCLRVYRKEKRKCKAKKNIRKIRNLYID